jgi:hypothetical protein
MLKTWRDRSAAKARKVVSRTTLRHQLQFVQHRCIRLMMERHRKHSGTCSFVFKILTHEYERARGGRRFETASLRVNAHDACRSAVMNVPLAWRRGERDVAIVSETRAESRGLTSF